MKQYTCRHFAPPCIVLEILGWLSSVGSPQVSECVNGSEIASFHVDFQFLRIMRLRNHYEYFLIKSWVVENAVTRGIVMVHQSVFLQLLFRCEPLADKESFQKADGKTFYSQFGLELDSL